MKRAYTLAEVLIVLAVLAVISALLLPSVLTSMPNKNKVRFRKAYATLSQAVYDTVNNRFMYQQLDRTKPVLTQPNVGADDSSLMGMFNLEQSGAPPWGVNKNIAKAGDAPTLALNEQFFCFSIQSLVHHIETSDPNNNNLMKNNCSAADTTDPNFVSVDGTAYYGLQGAFSPTFVTGVDCRGDDNSIGDPSKLSYCRQIYIDVDYMNPNRKQKLENDDYCKTNGTCGDKISNPNLFRVLLNANGQIVIEGEVERDYLTDLTNLKQ